MRHRFAAALLAASLLPVAAIAQAAGTNQDAQIQEQLRQDEEALKRTAQDLADLARQRFEAHRKELSKAARQSIDKAEAATKRALDQLRQSLDALFPEDEKAEEAGK